MDRDPAKSDGSFRNRGFDFAAAAQIFAGFALERADTRQDYGEPRILAIGEVARFVLTVVRTDRSDRHDDLIRRIFLPPE
ncbi:MAG: hypothetical protein MNPFHGCM_02686 [Gemmatimonadaceae bacterium]|nr:hypothetical protein [Gemmatimonadaceae bacterium]